MVNFGEVRRAQLAKSTILISTLVPLGSFRFSKVYSDAKGRVGCGKQREASAPFILSNTATLVPEFVVEDVPSAELQPTYLRLQ